jgi:hypothetical protein
VLLEIFFSSEKAPQGFEKIFLKTLVFTIEFRQQQQKYNA